jgi:hypothetical protein
MDKSRFRDCRELSMTLAQSQAYVYRSCTLLLAKAAERQGFTTMDTAFFDWEHL